MEQTTALEVLDPIKLMRSEFFLNGQGQTEFFKITDTEKYLNLKCVSEERQRIYVSIIRQLMLQKIGLKILRLFL